MGVGEVKLALPGTMRVVRLAGYLDEYTAMLLAKRTENGLVR